MTQHPKKDSLSLFQKVDRLKRSTKGGVAKAQWIRMRHKSSRPGFESQALRFYQFIFELFHVEKTKLTKRGRDWTSF